MANAFVRTGDDYAALVMRLFLGGVFFVHGSQKVPQKSTTTTLPRSPLSETVPPDPASVLRLKFGAGLPTRPPRSAADSAPWPS